MLLFPGYQQLKRYLKETSRIAWVYVMNVMLFHGFTFKHLNYHISLHLEDYQLEQVQNFV